MKDAGTFGRRDRKDYRKNYNKGAFAKSARDKPVVAGEEYDVQILGLTSTGRGFARIKGFMIIVADAEKGEKCKIQITRVESKRAIAKKTR